jgi:hypothetical protein
MAPFKFCPKLIHRIDPRNLLGLFPRVQPLQQQSQQSGGHLSVIPEESQTAKEDEEDAAMASN